MTKIGYNFGDQSWVKLQRPKSGTTSTSKIGYHFGDQSWVQLGQPIKGSWPYHTWIWPSWPNLGCRNPTKYSYLCLLQDPNCKWFPNISKEFLLTYFSGVDKITNVLSRVQWPELGKTRTTKVGYYMDDQSRVRLGRLRLGVTRTFKVGYNFNDQNWVGLQQPKLGTTLATKIGYDFGDQNWV